MNAITAVREASNQDEAENRCREFEEENELLLRQLHQVQEELERYFLQNQVHENGQSSTGQPLQWVDDDLPDAIAEVQRLRTVLDVQTRVADLVSQNALNVQLGEILIHGVDTPGALLGVPGRLLKVWRQSTQKAPPAELGKDFGKVITAHAEGGFDAVAKLLSSVPLFPVMKANAYTAVARHLTKSEAKQAAVAARKAYESDPRPYRLKWLAYRLHEAGEVIEAEAMLDVLPQDMQFSDSETRQADQIRHEARQVRLREVQQQTKYAERRAENERILKELAQSRDEQTRLAAELQEQLAKLMQSKVQSEGEKSVLAGQLEDQKKQLLASNKQVEELTRIRNGLEQEKLTLTSKVQEQQEENNLLLAQLHQVQEELERHFNRNAELEREKSALAGQLAEQKKQLLASNKEVEELTQIRNGLEQEKLTLTSRVQEQQEENSLLLEQLHQVLEELERHFNRNAELEREKSALAGRHEEQLKLVQERQAQLEQLAQAKAAVESERGREIEALKQTQVQRDQEIALLVQARDEQVQLAAERQAAKEALVREKAELAQAKAQLKLEKSALVGREEEAAKLAQERQAQIEQLAQAKAAVESERGREIEALKRAQAQRDQEIALLLQARDQQVQLAAERQAANEALIREKAELAQAKAQLEQEKSALAGRHEEQLKLAADRLKQINELQQQIQSRQAGEAELASRQQLMHDEMVRAEAQLDLIKEMLLREPGL
jgi:hypothetical protein